MSFEFENISEIIPKRLYLTGLKGVKSINNVLNLNIEIIVSTTDYDIFKHKKPKEYDNIKFVFYELQDHKNFLIINHFKEFCKLLDENPDKIVLVHCLAGISRSPSLVASYLVKKFIENKIEKNTIKDVIEYIRNRRICIFPNYGFILQLNQFRTMLLNNMEI